MRPIPTLYRGIRFRSRLEASWAQYFDHVGAEWAYEPEGYELSSYTRYLPDFYLEETKTWFECKGPLGGGIKKAARFCIESRANVVIGFHSGRFLVLGDRGAEEHVVPRDILELALREDLETLRFYMKRCSLLEICDHSRHRTFRFWNGGGYGWGEFAHDDEGGCVGERIDDDEDRGTVRPIYFTGMSTWANRNFQPTNWKPSFSEERA